MEITDYYPDKTLKFTRYMSKEGDVHEKYYPNGQMEYRHIYVDDMLCDVQEWYRNGKPKQEYSQIA